MFEYSGVIEKVVDGDTVDIDIDLGFDVHTKQRIRLARINCPEMKTAEGKPAKDFTMQYLGRRVTLRTAKTDKYGRYIGELLDGEVNISDELVKTGNAEYARY